MSVASRHMYESYHILPDAVVDLTEFPVSNDEKNTHHRHVVVILDDNSELWLDISTSQEDHNFIDVRWMNPAGEMKGTGVFTIVNGRRMSMGVRRATDDEVHGLPDTEGRTVRGFGWNGGYVTTLLVDKNGQEETAIVPSDGNG